MTALLQNILALNNEFAEQTSWMTPEELQKLIDEAFHFGHRDEGLDGFVIALTKGADYHSPNFTYFCERMDDFVYVDRIIVSARAQGKGTGRSLYDELGEVARAAGFKRIVCEVNTLPPNPGSIAFHTKAGFQPVEEVTLNPQKRVLYMEKPL